MNHPTILNPTKADWEIFIDQLGDECVEAMNSGNDRKAEKICKLLTTIYATVFNKKIA